MSTLVVEQAGLQTSVQDLGREGYGPMGVSPSGAADPVSLRLANLLVGNPAGAAALELTLQGGSYLFPEGARDRDGRGGFWRDVERANDREGRASRGDAWREG